MKKIYFVDSENVGDVWVQLLSVTETEDKVYVFYTAKSPYMNYESVRRLKEVEKEPVFIKCFEGTNALDFQLVTQLGYLLCQEKDSSYCIVSNDTGYDAVVRYWGERGYDVTRMTAKECSEKKEKGEEQELKADTAGEIVTALFSCISRENLQNLHNVLVLFLGPKQGKQVYQKIKGDKQAAAYWEEHTVSSTEERFDIYCHLVFKHSELAGEEPKDFASFLLKAIEKRKNLNSLRAAMQGHYGKEKGMKYYVLFKPHIKIMNCM